MKLTAEEKSKIKRLKMYNEYEWFVEISKLSYSSAFGELALINDAPRAATVRCVTDCYFAVLGRVDYKIAL